MVHAVTVASRQRRSQLIQRAMSGEELVSVAEARWSSCRCEQPHVASGVYAGSLDRDDFDEPDEEIERLLGMRD